MDNHGQQKKVECDALTCIDTMSNLVELIRIDNKTSCHIREKIVQCWLSCYPCPVCGIHDKSDEFIGGMFKWLLHSFDIKDVQSTSENLESNLICKGSHQTAGNVLRTLLYINLPQNLTPARNIVDQVLATAMHAMQVTVATTFGSMSGALAFSRNMFLDVPLIVDCPTTT
jgi:hypothetical protein